MKKISTLFCLFLLIKTSAFAQATRIVSGNIVSNTTFYSDTIYHLDGFVYVKNGATLTIQEGTIIKGVSGNRSSLIITRGSKINAQGSAERPIVFTSDKPVGQRNPGDWGGIIILGKAWVNGSDCASCPNEPGTQRVVEGDINNAEHDGVYGGDNDEDNSGVLSYVRLEFGGTVISPGNEINGLTMGGVGRGTKIDHIQVSFVNDDGFEWFGGTVNGKNLVSFRNIDDDFDTDFGYRGKVQFGIAFRDSMLDDKGSGPTTNGFESDNDGSGSEAKPFTEPVFSNITVVGPLARGQALAYTNSFQNGLRIRKNSGLSLHNSVVMGFPTGVYVDGARSASKFLSDSLMLQNNIISGWSSKAINAPAEALTNVENKFLANNIAMQSMNGLLKDPFNYTNPDFTFANGSIAASGASFTGNKIGDAFFTQTTFKGAMGTENWTESWTNWDPQTTDYSMPTVSIKKVTKTISFINAYPNPAKNVLNVNISLLRADNVSAAIYGIDGKCLQTVAGEQFAPGNQNLKFEISNLNNGLYLLKINTSQGQETIKFSVVK